MKENIKTILSLALLIPCLSACEDKSTYAYLMEHPAFLKDQIVRCQSQDSTQCETVMRAGEDMSAIVDDCQTNPERFGEKIIAMQMAYSQTQDMLRKAQQLLDELKAKQSSAMEIAKADDAVQKAKAISQEQREQITIALAVVGILSSPE